MRWQHNLRRGVWLVLPLWIASGSLVLAEGEPAENPSVFERIGNTAKKVGKKIEQGFTKAAKKLEQKKVGEKIERKLKKAARKTAEGFKKAGDKMDKKLGQ
jgi:hypothetical protein